MYVDKYRNIYSYSSICMWINIGKSLFASYLFYFPIFKRQNNDFLRCKQRFFSGHSTLFASRKCKFASSTYVVSTLVRIYLFIFIQVRVDIFKQSTARTMRVYVRVHTRTESFLESSGCRTRPLETFAYRT